MIMMINSGGCSSKKTLFMKEISGCNFSIQKIFSIDLLFMMWRCGFGERESSAPPSIASGRTSDNGERQPQVTMVDRTIHTASSSFTVRREYLYLRPIDKVDLDDSKKRSKDKRKQRSLSQTVSILLSPSTHQLDLVISVISTGYCLS